MVADSSEMTYKPMNQHGYFVAWLKRYLIKRTMCRKPVGPRSQRQAPDERHGRKHDGHGLSRPRTESNFLLPADLDEFGTDDRLRYRQACVVLETAQTVRLLHQAGMPDKTSNEGSAADRYR